MTAPTTGSDSASATTGAGRQRPGSPRRTVPRRAVLRWLALAAGVVLAAVLASVLFTGAGRPGSGSTDVAPGISAASARLLSLDAFGGSGAPVAAPIHLVDQHGTPTTLAQFRGKVVVWSLNDDQCVDMCTLYAQDMLAAQRDLGRAARHVVWLSVNANPYYPSPASLQSWSQKNDLAGLPNWVYLTGTPAQLQSTWNAYHVSVQLDAATHTVAHDFTMQFIDPQGRIRAVGSFGGGSVSTAFYGHALAQMADDLLPPSERVRVGGPALAAPRAGTPTIGGQAPPFTLPLLGARGTASLAAYRGKPLVLNFWSSTCTACTAEMPALQAVAQSFGSQLAVVGVDVADPRASAAAFARRLGVTYPLLSDHGGSTAAAYTVGALPVTFVISPRGTIDARHQGALTAPQLSAVVQLDFTDLTPAP